MILNSGESVWITTYVINYTFISSKTDQCVERVLIIFHGCSVVERRPSIVVDVVHTLGVSLCEVLQYAAVAKTCSLKIHKIYYK